MKPYDLFAACLPGLEELLAAEMRGADLGDVRIEPGGVAFAGHRNAVYRANLELGLCTRVLLHVGTFRVRSFPELIRRSAELPWERFLTAGTPFDVRATCKKSRLYHSGGVEERVALGILEKLGQRPELPEGDEHGWPTIRVRLVRDTCDVALDTSGRPLWQRGYKLDVAKAPLREDLARALVIASGWTRTSPLVDPMCGSGTIAIEAAGLARGLPPGRLREFAFQQTPLFDGPAWEAARIRAFERGADGAGIHASDRDAGAVEAARANADRAGVAGSIAIECVALSEAAFLSGTPAPPPRGAVVTNPPYGGRIGGDLRSLYQSLGKLCRALPAAWDLALLAANRRLALKTALKLETAFLTEHGGHKVRALVRRGARTHSIHLGTKG